MNTTLLPSHPNHDAPRQDARTVHGSPARALGGILLAAMVAALVVAADILIDRYADGHLVFAWIILWAVAFATMALFAPLARRSARRLFEALGSWRARRAQHVADQAFLAAARHDSRIMAELEAARERARDERCRVQLAHGRAWVDHRPVGTLHAAYTGPRNVFRTSPLPGLPMHLQYCRN